MEISKMLESIRLGNQDSSDIVKNLEMQQEELNRNLYLVKVMGIASEIDKLVSIKFFSDNSIKSMEVNYFIVDTDYSLICSLINYKNNTVYSVGTSIEGTDPELEKFKYLFKSINTINPQYLEASFEDSYEFSFDLKKGAGNSFVNHMLSKELKAFVEYSKLENDLAQNEVSKPKKPKV